MVIVAFFMPQLVKPAGEKNTGRSPVESRAVAEIELEKLRGITAFNVSRKVTFKKAELGAPDAGPNDLEITKRQIGSKSSPGVPITTCFPEGRVS